MNQELEIVMTDDRIPRIDSRVVSKGIGVQHDNLMQTIGKYQSGLEKYGILLFQTGKSKAVAALNSMFFSIGNSLAISICLYESMTRCEHIENSCMTRFLYMKSSKEYPRHLFIRLPRHSDLGPWRTFTVCQMGTFPSWVNSSNISTTWKPLSTVLWMNTP